MLAGARYRVDSEGLSKIDLIGDLTRAGYSRAHATYAANKVGADWKEEAVEQARNRLDDIGYSRRSLFEHLGADGFTRAQAKYAVSKVYD